MVWQWLATCGSYLWDHYHDHWIDPMTVVVAIAYAIVKHFRCTPRLPILSKETRRNVLDGVALLPVILLTLSAFSDELTAQVLKTNKVILFFAGVSALFAILET